MGHVEDRWYKTLRHPGGQRERVKTELFGKGLRYRVRYIGPDGKERKKSFPDRAKREAEAFLVSTESDKLRGSYVDPKAGRITFAEYAENWLRTRSFDESTRESTEFRVRKHLLPFFGSEHLASIKPGHIREWDASMVGKLAPATRAVVFAHLRTILGAAVDDERIAKNPVFGKVGQATATGATPGSAVAVRPGFGNPRWPRPAVPPHGRPGGRLRSAAGGNPRPRGRRHRL